MTVQCPLLSYQPPKASKYLKSKLSHIATSPCTRHSKNLHSMAQAAGVREGQIRAVTSSTPTMASGMRLFIIPLITFSIKRFLVSRCLPKDFSATQRLPLSANSALVANRNAGKRLRSVREKYH